MKLFVQRLKFAAWAFLWRREEPLAAMRQGLVPSMSMSE
jgi:hypothetical protein